jgi:hypothetical protein
MRLRGSAYVLLAVSVCLSASVARATTNCTGLPTTFTGNQFPKGNFFSNFDNSCYLIPFASWQRGQASGGDLNSIYAKLFYKVNPAYQLIIVGAFPDARYFSVTELRRALRPGAIHCGPGHRAPDLQLQQPIRAGSLLGGRAEVCGAHRF